MKKKVRHFIPANSNRTSCDVKAGKKTNVTYISCLITCEDCKNKLNIPVNFINKKLVE